MNKLPQMPIRAKYADELTEGSPDRIKLDTLPVALNVADVKALTTAQCNSLKCGDIVTKEDATGKHAYIVSYKKDGTGMCLTYADGSGYIETVSYDLTGDEWVYNSTDVFNASSIPELTGDTVKEIFNTKPKMIDYDGLYYVLQDLNGTNLYYVSVYNDDVYSVYIDSDNWSIGSERHHNVPSTSSLVGGTQYYLGTDNQLYPEWLVLPRYTKIYKHSLSWNMTAQYPMNDGVVVYCTASTPITKESVITALGTIISIDARSASELGISLVNAGGPPRIRYYRLTGLNSTITYEEIKLADAVAFTDTVTEL